MVTLDSPFLPTIGQIFLDAVLFLAIWILYRRIRHLDPGKIDYLVHRLDENARLIRELDANLREKERISNELADLLERTSKRDKASGSPSGAPPGEDRKRNVRDLAVSMWADGKDIQEISLATGLFPGEIELLIDLSRPSTAKEMPKGPPRS